MDMWRAHGVSGINTNTESKYVMWMLLVNKNIDIHNCRVMKEHPHTIGSKKSSKL